MRSTRTTTRRIITLAAFATTPVVLSACSSNGTRHAGDIDAIRSNPSPAMHSISERYTDRLNTLTHKSDTDLRAFNDDIDRLFYLDRPSRLRPGIKP